MVSGEAVLKNLLEGNQRYVNNKQIYPNQTRKKRLELKLGQKPHSIILGCSDSRVPPEVIFDQGLGDLFVIRVAGNVIDDIVLGSIEYAAEHLDSSLLMVLGHSDCGAVQAAMDDIELDGHLPSIAEAIEEAVISRGLSNDINEVVKEHANITSKHLKQSYPVLAPLVKSNKLLVVSAFYNFDTGIVEILKE